MSFLPNPAARKGITHLFTKSLVAFEHFPNSVDSHSNNVIIFVGGLSDGLLTVPYASTIADHLPPSWSLAQVLLSSSYSGWGTSSLEKDVAEISAAVSYFRKIKDGKIVLLGHSTGCQDALRYLTGPGHETRAPIDAAIIQAPVSDREALVSILDPSVYRESCVVAEAMVASGNGEEILPSRETQGFFPAPVSARRWLSLASPHHDGDDDYFSTDLTDEQLKKTFGSLPSTVPFLILFSGSDEYVGPEVDKAALVKRWIGVVKESGGNVDEEYSGVVEGASHNLAGNPEDVVLQLVRRVLGFTDGLR
ncbi:esterase lipase [Phlyctema vagabunda]|uniref:Esterase lipase n=1 Tax=Phlyctema vagabunda TaxID=108571 RepID=A0ABR4PY64_9HELO